MKSKKTAIIFCLAAIVAGVILFAFLFYVNVFVKKAPTFENRKFPTLLHTIEKGTNFTKLGWDLKEKDLIASKFWFDTYFLLSGRWTGIKAGTYDLPYGSTTAQIASIISHGLVKKEKVTILPGWNLSDIAKSCEEKSFFSQADFFKAAGNPERGIFSWWVTGQEKQNEQTTESATSAGEASVFKRIAADFNFLSQSATDSQVIYDLEGFLFPDTYEFNYPVMPEEVIRKALDNFQKKVPLDLRQGDFYQTMVMASILEKEVRSYKDKQVVAGILWKRLKENWPLQVDSTLNYAMGDSSAKMHLSDLEFDSPYNTYKYKGLPPGPICNPGIESIKAAVYYENTQYWYYLSAKNGKTIFSKTFSQHVAAKARYLK